MASSSETRLRYRFGPFELDPAEGSLSRNGRRVKLQDLPYRLLLMLVERPGDVVTREEVRQGLWPENTFVEFDNSLGVAIGKIRDSLGDDAETPRYVETIPRRGYRFIAPVQAEGVSTSPLPPTEEVPALKVEKNRAAGRARAIAVGAFLALALLAAGWYWRGRMSARLPERAPVVVGDFANSTGDPLFEGSLRRAVVIQLTQSPYLSIVPDGKLGEILQDLGRSPDDTLSPALARQVCQRGQALALILGSIQKTGAGYLLSMEASRCGDGSSLAHETVTVASQAQVVPRLGVMVDDFRRKLGESPESLQKFDVPVEQATTSSLEALKAYQLGVELRAHSKNLESRPAFQTAIALDPDFAIAYAQLGSAYSNEGNTLEGKKYFRKAFELRARATEPERLYITGRYFDIVTGESEKGSETYKLWTELYPNEWRPYNALANDANLMGRYETVVDASRQAVRLGPNQNFGYANLVSGLIGLNRLDEAKQICEQLLAAGHDDSFIHLDLFGIAYFQQDAAALNRETEWGRKHSNDPGLLYARAQAAAAEGKITVSTTLFEEVARANLASNDSESAADALSVTAEINSEMGKAAIAQEKAAEAQKLGKNEIILGLGALVAARAHDWRAAQERLDELDHDYPLATFNLGVFSPMIRTTMEVSRGSSTARVTSLMEPTLAYELGFEADLLPIYVRGVSYLEAHSPEDAAREFQKLIDHRNVDTVTTLYPLSELGLARSYAALGKKAESRAVYQKLFTLWKDADSDLPVLLSARKEIQALR